jgi:hypothetical protein
MGQNAGGFHPLHGRIAAIAAPAKPGYTRLVSYHARIGAALAAEFDALSEKKGAVSGLREAQRSA